MSLLFCFAASDTTKSKAPKEETPSLEKTNLVTQSAQLPIPGYTSQQSQQAANFGLGTRLKEAWKSALPAKQSV
ncbi:hypothetical protein N7490_008606 [Penicillium lividum]|nr:hypothetical protein N7490_008606 [Penicillium lividum]